MRSARGGALCEASGPDTACSTRRIDRDPKNQRGRPENVRRACGRAVPGARRARGQLPQRHARHTAGVQRGPPILVLARAHCRKTGSAVTAIPARRTARPTRRCRTATPASGEASVAIHIRRHDARTPRIRKPSLGGTSRQLARGGCGERPAVQRGPRPSEPVPARSGTELLRCLVFGGKALLAAVTAGLVLLSLAGTASAATTGPQTFFVYAAGPPDTACTVVAFGPITGVGSVVLGQDVAGRGERASPTRRGCSAMGRCS